MVRNYKCTECGEIESCLYSTFPESKIIKIQHCRNCDAEVDKYIQIETTLLILDLLLLRKAAFRHLLCNHQMGNIVWRVAVFCLFCDGYMKWMPQNFLLSSHNSTMTMNNNISITNTSAAKINDSKREDDIIFHAAKQFKFYEISASCAIDQLFFLVSSLVLCKLFISCEKLFNLKFGQNLKYSVFDIVQSLLLANCVKLLSIPVVIWAKKESPKYLWYVIVHLLFSSSTSLTIPTNLHYSVSFIIVFLSYYATKMVSNYTYIPNLL